VANRASALVAAVGLIASHRFELELPPPAPDDTVSDAELLAATATVAGWLVQFSKQAGGGMDGETILRLIGTAAGWVAATNDEQPPETKAA
jgi:hypothetical protein